MKTIKVKRLVYSYNPNMAHIDAYGGFEYDGHLSDKNILDAIYEPGYWDWSPYWKNMLEKHNADGSALFMQVRTFYRYEKTWWDLFCDTIKRILRI